MKYLLLLVSSFILVNLSAQTYPFADGFHGDVSGQVPTGWSGDIPVLSYHGQNEEKGLAAEIGGADLVDSIVSPLVGPLTNTSTISFFYRIIDKNIYPSTPTVLGTGDKVEVFVSTDSVNYQSVFAVDENNHTASFNFAKKKVFIPQYQGQNIQVKFVCSFGAGATYYVDIDSIEVKNDPFASIGSDNMALAARLYPNPTTGNAIIATDNSQAYTLAVYDILGKVIYTNEDQGSTILPSAEWSKGLYFVQVNQQGHTYSQKLVVQ